MNISQEERAEGPRVVVIGGGTGISASLRGMKVWTDRLTAIVTVADDGGSSGRLRKDYHVLPPGDLRNCLVALADGDPLLQELFNYRFEDSILQGHSFGNLFLVVLTRLTGSARAAIERARALLGVRARVLPSTTTRVVLVASHDDGTKSTGEQCISRSAKEIVGMALRPPPPAITREIEEVLKEAELIVIGPGSLYTSLIPNLLVPGMSEAISQSAAQVIVVGNLMTQPGETDGFSLERHVRVLRDLGGLSRIDGVLVNIAEADESVRRRYAEKGAAIIPVDERMDEVLGIPLHRAQIASVSGDQLWRHDAARLAEVLIGLVRKNGRGAMHGG